MSRPKPSTIEDVARVAAVSTATVSRALRGHPNVAAATRQQVERAARLLNYRADPAASRLASRRSSTVAVIVPMLESWYFSTVMAAVERLLTSNGFDLAIYVTDPYDAARKRAISWPHRAEGTIFVDVAVSSHELDQLVESGLPTVSIGLDFPGLSTVTVDDVAIGAEATTHLLDLGHRSIGLIGGSPHDRFDFQVHSRRREGYQQALSRAGRAVQRDLQIDGGFCVRGGFEAMTTLLDLDEPPTAVFAMSDEMAFGALKAIRDRGLSVPRDISIVGVDDHPLAWVEDLTTIDQQVHDHGRIAAQLLLDQIEALDDVPTHSVLSAQLVNRRSTAPRNPAD